MEHGGVSDRGTTAILSAVDEELAALRERLRGGESSPSNTDWQTGRLAGRPVLLGATGVGNDNARRGVAEAICRAEPDRVLYVGTAGGLDPDLETADLVVVETIVGPGDPVPEPDLEWREGLAASDRLRTATAVTVESAVTEPAEKRRLWRELDRPPRGIVDMESAGVARRCAADGVPFLVVRSVSDTARDSLPDYLSECRTESGDISRLKVAANAVRNPTSIFDLGKMAGRVRECSRALADAVPKILRRLPS